MHSFGVRPASKPEIKDITAWFIQERSKDARFVHLSRSAWQRFLMRNWVLPRYLRSQAHTFVLEQDTPQRWLCRGRADGRLHHPDRVQRGRWIRRVRPAAGPDQDRRGDGQGPRVSLRTHCAAGQQRAAPGSVPLGWLRAGGLLPVELHRRAGWQPSWSAKLRCVRSTPKRGWSSAVDLLRQELEASEVATRAVIESSLFPRRPSTFPSYSIELAEPGSPGDASRSAICLCGPTNARTGFCP